MGIWVRNQWGTNLICVTSIYYEQIGLQEHTIIGDKFWALGRYDTMERCLEIIDELQLKIANDIKIYSMPTE